MKTLVREATKAKDNAIHDATTTMFHCICGYVILAFQVGKLMKAKGPLGFLFVCLFPSNFRLKSSLI